jgi:hypothetical protein
MVFSSVGVCVSRSGCRRTAVSLMCNGHVTIAGGGCICGDASQHHPAQMPPHARQPNGARRRHVAGGEERRLWNSRSPSAPLRSLDIPAGAGRALDSMITLCLIRHIRAFPLIPLGRTAPPVATTCNLIGCGGKRCRPRVTRADSSSSRRLPPPPRRSTTSMVCGRWIRLGTESCRP